MRRLFDPDLVHLCSECGDALDADVVPAEQPGYWSHTQCDLEAALESDTIVAPERPDLLPLVLADTRRTAVERPPPPG